MTEKCILVYSIARPASSGSRRRWRTESVFITCPGCGRAAFQLIGIARTASVSVGTQTDSTDAPLTGSETEVSFSPLSGAAPHDLSYVPTEVVSNDSNAAVDAHGDDTVAPPVLMNEPGPVESYHGLSLDYPTDVYSDDEIPQLGSRQHEDVEHVEQHGDAVRREGDDDDDDHFDHGDSVGCGSDSGVKQLTFS